MIDFMADQSPKMNRPRSQSDLNEGERAQQRFFDSRENVVRKELDKKYVILSAEDMTSMALRIENAHPDRFLYKPIRWRKFPDNTDNIKIEGFSPVNHIASSNVLFLASFHNNDVTLSQFSVLIVLLQSFISSLTIVLPFYPVGTNERVDEEGRVATANTYSMLLSSLPNIGRPIRLMIYDIHALQERFYFHGATLPSLHTALPLLYGKLRLEGKITHVAFPDDGAAKRFKNQCLKENYEVIICGKVRHGDQREITIQEGEVADNHIIIIDDLVQTGGTLYECASLLRERGAASVSAYVTHGVFPNQSWKRFCREGDRGIFDKFYVTNSIPTVSDNLPKDNVFEVLDLTQQIVTDLTPF